MRFLLDTNILIPLEDSHIPLEANLADFIRLSNENGHQLVYHPASEKDLERDSNSVRRQQTLNRLRQYTRLDPGPDCPWNDETTTENDRVDNQILYALECGAAHALVTEDHAIHRKAKRRNLGDRVFYIQTAETWLRQLHDRVSITLPNIEEVSLYTLTPCLGSQFFDSLRNGYPQFDSWFSRKSKEGTKAWVYWASPNNLGAICIFDRQIDQTITSEGLRLPGSSLKLCTFKVETEFRGRKIGELFLKAAFRFATFNRLEHIFIHGDVDTHRFLFDLLDDFGFTRIGSHVGSGNRDAVYLKKHPLLPPTSNALAFPYLKEFYPHFRRDTKIQKFIVPIRPTFHEIFFPDYEHPAAHQNLLFRQPNSAGNAIKLAYLCNAQISQIEPGSIMLFYRSVDHRAVTSLAVVESYESTQDASKIAQVVSRRTVYSLSDIEKIAQKPTKVMLFRHVKHLKYPVDREWMLNQNLIDGNIQTIRQITDQIFEKIYEYGER